MAEVKRSSLPLLMVVQLTTRFRGGIISPILSLFIRDQGLTITHIGLLGTASMLGWLLFEPLMGVLADRIRKKWLVIFSIIGSTIIYTLYPFAYNFTHFALLGFSMSSVMSAYAVAIKALIAELLPKESRGKAYGRYLSVISFGGVIAPFLGGYISVIAGYSIPFYISAGIGVITLIAILLIKYDDKHEKEKTIKNQSWSDVLTGTLLSIYAIRGLFMFNMIFRQSFLPIYLNESPNFMASEAQIGAYLTIAGLTTSVSQIFLGDLNDKIGSKKMIVTFVAFLGFSYFGLISLTGLIPLYILALIQGVLIAGAEMSIMIHLMNVMPEGRTGIIMGLYSESENVGGLIANPALGYTYDNFGSMYSIILLSSMLFLTSIVSWGLIKKPKIKEILSTTRC
jgi:MFS family permease